MTPQGELLTSIRVGDAFGSMLLDLLHDPAGGHVEILEREDGNIQPGMGPLYFSSSDAWGRLDNAACDMVTGRILDIGAGAGRHSLHLQSRGLEVTALDVSPGAITVCQERGVRDARLGTVPALVDAQRDRFDTFLLLGGNVGLLSSPSAAPALFGALRTLASPGARIITGGPDPYLTDNPAHLNYHELNRRRGRPAGQTTIRVRYRDLSTPWFDYWLLAPDELAAVAGANGWRLTSADRDGRQYLAVLGLAG